MCSTSAKGPPTPTLLDSCQLVGQESIVYSLQPDLKKNILADLQVDCYADWKPDLWMKLPSEYVRRIMCLRLCLRCVRIIHGHNEPKTPAG